MIPKLRFNGYTEDWANKTLGDIGEVRMCKRIFNSETSQSGDIPFFKIGTFGKTADAFIDRQLYETYREKYNFPSKGDILISASGTLGRRVRYNGEAAYYQDSNIVWIENNEELVTNQFLYFLYEIVRYESEGGTIQRLYNSIIKRAKIGVPSIAEQNKITLLLNSIDQKINLLTKKKEALETYKKGLMQKIFSQELRFKREDGTDYPEWESLSFSAVFDRVKRKNKNGLETVLTISAQLGLVDPTEYFSRDVSSSDKRNYTLLHRNEFAYNKSYSKGYPLGAIKRNTRYDVGVLSPLYICFACKYEAYIEYYEHYFESGIFNKQIYRIAQEGARNHGLLNVSVTEFFEDTILEHPSKEESLKISNILTKFDALITSVSEKLGAAEQLKKGILQQMFV